MDVEPADVAIAANPFSGAKGNRQRVDALCAALRAVDLTPHVVWDIAAESHMLRDPQWQRGCRCMVCAGGDGTVGAVVNILDSRDVPIAVLPLGNENLLAKELGFMVEPAALAQAIARRRTRHVDLAKANDRYFTLMLSAGFDAAVVHRVAAWRAASEGLRRVKHRSYMKPLLSATWSYSFDPIELIADGQSVRGAMAMVVNVPRYALGMQFTPDAKPDDGLLHWVMFEKPGRLSTFGYALSVLRGRHANRPDVRFGSATALELRAETAAPVQMDGDAAGHTPVTVRIVPEALTLIDTAP